MKYADVLAQTYFDTCSIYRYEPVVVNGVTRSTAVLKYSDIACSLSQGSLVKATGENAAEISANSKVFCRPEVDLKEGDKLVILQQGSQYPKEYKAGEIFMYANSHLEARVTRTDKI